MRINNFWHEFNFQAYTAQRSQLVVPPSNYSSIIHDNHWLKIGGEDKIHLHSADCVNFLSKEIYLENIW